MSTCVCVLSNNGERLMPTIRLGRVRHLLKDGKAKIIKHHPFTIQLQNEGGESPRFQPWDERPTTMIFPG